MEKCTNFSNIRNYEQFRSKVPVVRYEEMEPFIERTRCGEQNVFWPTPIRWFAKSSGTTNAKSKFIPVSERSFTGVSLQIKQRLAMSISK